MPVVDLRDLDPPLGRLEVNHVHVIGDVLAVGMVVAVVLRKRTGSLSIPTDQTHDSIMALVRPQRVVV